MHLAAQNPQRSQTWKPSLQGYYEVRRSSVTVCIPLEDLLVLTAARSLTRIPCRPTGPFIELVLEILDDDEVAESFDVTEDTESFRAGLDCFVEYAICSVVVDVLVHC